MAKQAKMPKAAPKAAPKKAGPTVAPKPEGGEDLVVFALRLSSAERELVHRAAGPGKASRFARSLLVAAANGDEKAVLELLGGPAPAVN